MQKQHAETVAEEEVLELEDIASCQICKDVLKSPMLLPCGHTYCSLCIQRWLGEKRYCPTCREEFDQHHALLRKNIALGQIMAGTVGPAYGWRLPFLLAAAPAILLALLLVATVDEPERGRRPHAMHGRRAR